MRFSGVLSTPSCLNFPEMLPPLSSAACRPCVASLSLVIASVSFVCAVMEHPADSVYGSINHPVSASAKTRPEESQNEFHHLKRNSSNRKRDREQFPLFASPARADFGELSRTGRPCHF